MSEEAVDKDRVFRTPDGREIKLDLQDIEYIFKGYRPRLMSLEDFKFVSRILRAEVKRHLRGKFIHVSKVRDDIWEDYVKDMKFKPKQRGMTYVKSGGKQKG